MYLVADQLDLAQAQFTEPHALTQLDDGFDVYATQAINAPDGRALAVSWIGLPEIAYPTDRENWAHCLSLVKELTLKDGHLYQNPVAAVDDLRMTAHDLVFEQQRATVAALNGSFELLLTVPADKTVTVNIADQQESGQLQVTVDANHGQVMIDRRHTGNSFAEDYGQTRQVELTAHKTIKIRLIIDVSVFECYIDNGYSVMTGRFFLNATPSRLNVQGDTTAVTGKVWEWRQSEHTGVDNNETKIK